MWEDASSPLLKIPTHFSLSTHLNKREKKKWCDFVPSQQPFLALIPFQLFYIQDADILWFRNPFLRFFEDADFQIACDHFLGDPYDVQNKPNGGFNFVKSNNRTIQFYKFWYSSQAMYPGYHDQDVLNFIKFDPFIRDIGLKMRFLDTMYFGGLCEPSKDLNQVCTMHANCCFGLDSKLNDLRMMLQDWKDFMSLKPMLKRSLNLSWSVPDKCR